jgi:hypothetical protein
VESFGINVSSVKAMIDQRTPTEVPMMPGFMRGDDRPDDVLRAQQDGIDAVHLPRDLSGHREVIVGGNTVAAGQLGRKCT